MPLKFVRADITTLSADIIVNTANPDTKIGSGTDSSIYKKAGKFQLFKDRLKIGRLKEGDVALTSAYNLKAKYIIHAVGPIWKDGLHSEQEKLESCYQKCLEIAIEKKCNSIAFPLLSSGNNGFSKELALNIALKQINSFLLKHDLLVYLVIFDNQSFTLSKQLTDSIDEYITQNYVKEKLYEEYIEFEEQFKSSPTVHYQRSHRPNSYSASRSKVWKDKTRPSSNKQIVGNSLSDTLEIPDHIDQEPVLYAQESKPSLDFDIFEQAMLDNTAVYEASKEFDLLQKEIDLDKEYGYSSELGALPPINEEPELAVKPLLDTSDFEDTLKIASPLIRTPEDHTIVGLDDYILPKIELGLTFQQKLFYFIDLKDLKDSTVYNRANMSKQTFAKIRKDVNYHPKKKTVLALAIGLQLNLDETKELLECAGYALSNSILTDVIFSWFINKKNYNINFLNIELFNHGCEQI